MQQKLKTPKYPPAKILKIFERFRYFLVRLSRQLTPANVTIIEMVQGFYVTRAIGVAADLNLAEYLKNDEKSIIELAKLTKAHKESLYRLMRMLVSQGIFIEKKNHVFANNRLSRTMLDQQNSMRHMIIHQVNSINWNMFEELDYVVKTGKNAAQKVLGMDVFEYLEKNPDRNEIYNQAMTNSSTMLSYAILSEYNFSKAKNIIDIGGGQGILLSMILHKYPKISGAIFDLPHVVEGAKEIANQFKVSDRLDTISGNFFENIPAGSDMYFLKSIIHNLSDEQCIKLLKDIKTILPENGKILIFEPIIENNNRYSFAKLYDIQMLVGRSGGKERTRKEFEEIIQQSGLKLNRIIQTAAPFSIIEVKK
ncbi:MAG: methyltransferase domain-containing protein [Bacteroidales bacterium]|nr:methyltransferase domain-containing protein [Bacteroidales bacterium]